MPPDSSVHPTGTVPPASAPADRSGTFALFKRLDTCHADIERRLERLRALAVALSHDGLTRTARAEARMALNWFDDHARRHHREEEEIIFPALLASGDPILVERTQRLIQDHGWLETDWQQIVPLLRAAVSGDPAFDVMALRHAVELFVQLQRDHMVREETLAYPEARWRLVPNLHRRKAPASA